MKKFYTYPAGVNQGIFAQTVTEVTNGFRPRNGWIRIFTFSLLAFFTISFAQAQNASATWSLTAGGAATASGNITVTNVAFGAGLSVAKSPYSVNGVAVSGLNETGQTATDYLEFTIAPAADYALTVTSILTTNKVSALAATNNARFQLYYSFSSAFEAPLSLGSPVIPGTAAATTAGHDLNIVVSAGQKLYVRIFIWGLSAAGTEFSTKDFTILGNACPAVAISYPQAAYCKYAGTTAMPARTGPAGGSYTSAPGLAINSSTGVIDVAGSTAGTYTVTYTAPGGTTGCPSVGGSTTVTINDLPIAFNLTGPDGATGAFCTNGTPATFTLSGSQEGVTYTFNAINPGGNTPPGQNFTVEGVGGTLEFVQTPDGKWSYKVTGKDDLTGCTNTMEGVLTAVDGPQVTSQPATALSVCAGGGPVALTLNVNNANSLTWQVSTDGGTTWSTLSNSAPYGITKATNNSTTTLTISNYTTGMNGYRYRVMYGGPAACPVNYSNGTVLTVSAPPAITTQPVSKAICANSNFSLSVAASNGATYQWYRNGVQLAGATAPAYTKTFDPGTDAGNYTVVVTGSCGSVTSSVATVSLTNTTVWQGPAAGGTTGLAGTAWEQAANWTCGVPTRTTDAIIPTDIVDGYPTIRPAITGEVRNLTINGGGFGAFLTVLGKLQVFGEVVNNGAVFDASTGTIEFAGSSTQTIPSGLFAGNTVQNLVISNNVTLGGALNLTGALSFGAVNNKTFATADFLTLKSALSATARVADLTNNNTNSGNAITGNVTVERYIPAHSTRRWRLVTAPVTGTTIHKAWQEDRAWNGSNAEPGQYGTLITGNAQGTAGTANTNGFDFWSSVAGAAASVRKYLPSAALSSNIGANWIALENTTTASFAGHEAYLLFVRGDRTVSAGTAAGATILRAKGPLKQNTRYEIAVPVSQSHTLVGNPYASPIDFSKLYAANSTSIQPYFWIWRANFGTTGAYVMVQPNGKGGYEAVPGDGSTLAVDPIISSGEGFFVVPAATAGVGNTITLQETHKSTGQPAFSVFRQAGTGPAKLRVNIYRDLAGEKTLLDGVLAQFSAGAAEGNRVKAVNIDENLSIVKAGQDLIVATEDSPKAGDSLALRFWNAKTGAYTLELKGMQFARDGLVALLYDQFLDRETPFALESKGLSYTFRVSDSIASQDPLRFVVRFRAAQAQPVKLVSFSAQEKAAGEGVQLAWQAEGAENVASYTVERSEDGNLFTSLLTVAANGRAIQAYEQTDRQPLPLAYYRLRINEGSGAPQYSAVVKIARQAGEDGMTVYPNPVTGRSASLRLAAGPAGTYQLLLYAASGQQVWNKTLQHAGGTAVCPVPVDTLANGTYLLELRYPGGRNEKRQLLVAH